MGLMFDYGFHIMGYTIDGINRRKFRSQTSDNMDR